MIIDIIKANYPNMPELVAKQLHAAIRTHGAFETMEKYQQKEMTISQPINE